MPSTGRAPPIERLPSELLDKIFSCLYLEGGYYCALVARTWLQPARRAIYGHIRLSSRTHAEQVRSEKLCHALSACTPARDCVRDLEIWAGARTDDPRFPHMGWLNHIREGQLRRLTIRICAWTRPTIGLRPVLLQSPARSSVKFLETNGPLFDGEDQSSSASDIIDFPRLESLSITLDIDHVLSQWHRVRFTRLRHLTIRGYNGLTHSMSQVLQTVPESVISLGIQWSSSRGMILEKLHINLNVSEPASVLDDALPYLTALKELRCTGGSYSARIFLCLPPRLETLYMYYCSKESYLLIDPAVLQHASAAVRRVTSGQLALQNFHYAMESDLTIEGEFAEECHSAGIDFFGWSFYRDRLTPSPDGVGFSSLFEM